MTIQVMTCDSFMPCHQVISAKIVNDLYMWHPSGTHMVVTWLHRGMANTCTNVSRYFILEILLLFKKIYKFYLKMSYSSHVYSGGQREAEGGSRPLKFQKKMYL